MIRLIIILIIAVVALAVMAASGIASGVTGTAKNIFSEFLGLFFRSLSLAKKTEHDKF